MKTLPIDSSVIEFRTVEVVGVFDRDSGEQKTSRDGNVPMWAIRCLARVTNSEFAKPEVVDVRVPSLTNLGDVLPPFELVKFENLVARPWAMSNDRSGVNDGVTFSATGVATVKPGKNGAVPPKAEPVGAVA